MTDSSGIITKQLGVWTIHYRPTRLRLFNRSSISKVCGFLKEKAVKGTKMAFGISILEQARSTGASSPSNGTSLSDSPPELGEGGEMKHPTTNAKAAGTTSYLVQFVREVYSLGPVLFYVELLCEAWEVIEATMTVYSSNRLLEAASQCLRKDTCSTANVVNALLLRFGVAVFHEFAIKPL